MLKRKYARLCTVLYGMTLLCALIMLGGVIFQWRQWRLRALRVLLTPPALLGIAGIIYVRFTFLRCPFCGGSAARPYWNPGHAQFCVKCGKPFVFDDEA